MLRNYFKKAVVMFISFIMLIGIFPNFSVSAEDVSNLQPVDSTYAFIKSLEGYSSECFWDVAQWTIGYGNKCPYTHTSNGVRGQKGGHTISEAQARDLFSSKLSGYVSTLKSNCKGLSMTQNQFDALLSATYNHGNVNNCPLKYYLQGKLTESEARAQYYEWCINAGTADEKGLRNRRKKEADLFFSNPNPDPPEIPTLSISKNLFSIDETVNISFNPIENATWYFMSLYRNGELYINEGVDTLINLKLPAGNYIAYVSANNDCGNAGVDSVEFKIYDSVPAIPDLNINKTLFSKDETINISFDAIENTEYYFMSLYRNGELYINEGVDTSINLKLPAGDYIAYVSANSNYGNAGVGSVKFKVYDTVPNAPDLKMEKNLFSADESVNISFDSIENTEYYFMSLYRNGELYKNEGVDCSINLNLPAGDYTAYISANNNFGNNGASSIKFKVYETAPDIPKLKINKTVFLKDEDVNISFNQIENTEWYFMSLYRNGELYINEGVDNSINLKLPVGNYIAYVSANNDYGNAGTDSIEFSVIENGDVNSDGDFNISDVVLLQKWLLAVPDTELAYWKAADLCEDGRLDVFDLCMMKRMLVENS